MPEVLPIVYIIVGAALTLRGLVYWEHNRKGAAEDAKQLKPKD